MPDQDELMRTIEALQRRLEAAEASISELRNQIGTPLDSRVNALQWPARIISPLSTAKRYVIRREAGGNLSVVAAGSATSNWSDA